MKYNIFTYGTLMFSKVAEPIAGIVQAGTPALLRDFARYTIEDRERAKVPALVEEKRAEVQGVVYRDVSESVIKALDNFEDIERHPQYERRIVRVQLESGDVVDAETYVANTRALSMLGEAWNPEKFQSEELQYYIETVVPRYTIGDRALKHSFFFKVKDTFLIEGRGLIVVPSTSQERFSEPIDIDVQLRKPDGSIASALLKLYWELQSPSSSENRLTYLFPELGKSDVPIGTEIWVCAYV